jgi:predicted Zn finger-like uncharacterized protein
MIVVCTTCQARFKVADEKIGPRGAKVRCSKCQTVFIVHKELGVMAAEGAPAAAPPPPAPPPPPARGMELDLEGEPMSGTRPSGFIADPFARPGQSAAPDPFAVPAAPAPDPFAAQPPAPAAAAAPQDPFGAADPFAAQAPPAAPQDADPFAAPDPFGGAPRAASPGLGAVDPFVATVASSASSAPSAPGLPTSAVTDLSDLLGGSGPPAPPPPYEPPPESQPESQPEPSGILESGFDFDAPGGAAAPPGSMEPAFAPPLSSGGEAADADLALAERTPAQPLPAVPMPGVGDFAGADPFGDPAGADFGAVPFDASPGESLDVAGPAAPSPRPEPLAPSPAAAPPAAPSPEPSRSGAAVETTGETLAAAGLRQRSSRLRAVAINAISLVALLAVASGFLALWRGARPGSWGLGRQDRTQGASETFAVSQLRSGIYDRADASPILFVAGKVLSHATAAVPGLRVRVEVVRKGAVLARGEARAGALLGPEELAGARDAAALEAAASRAAAQAPAEVKPGDSVPFLVAISDFPPEVVGAGLSVSVEPTVEAPPASPVAPPPAPAPPPPGGPTPP